MSVSALSPTRATDPFAALWDEPENTASIRSTRPAEEDDEHAPSPAKRARKSTQLFLSDEENDDDTGGRASGSKNLGAELPPELEAMFDVDDDDQVYNFNAPSMAELNRQAESKLSQSTSVAKTQTHVIDMSGAVNDAQADKSTGDKKDDLKKVKKKPPKLDETRLVGPHGFPALMKASKNFRVQGKGHELSDLKRTLELYQLWAHRMYPKMQFRDTAERVQKLTHTKRMTVSLGVWKEEYHHGPKKEDDDDAVDFEHADEEEEVGDESHSRQLDENGNFVPLSSSRSEATSRGPTGVKSGKTLALSSEDDLDAVDLDELMADAHESRGQMPSTSKPSSVTDDLDDDEMWNIADDVEAEAPSRSTGAASNPKTQNSREARDDDAEMWADMLNDDDLEAFMNEDMDTSVASKGVDAKENGARLEAGGSLSASEVVVPANDNERNAPTRLSESTPPNAAFGMEVDDAGQNEDNHNAVEKSFQERFEEGWDDMYE
ncbi:hypothetical protein FRC03_001530 [Tulasnella sp. 419]|nr:hypothetical protein FRC03_001530 [Tulasnella sp. 419]